MSELKDALTDAPIYPLAGSALKEAVDLTKKLAQPITSEAIHFVVVPNDCGVKSLAELQYPDGIRPSRIKQVVSLKDAGSFCDYFNSYADDRARVFANPDEFRFVGILDYHGTGARLPEFCSHRTVLQLKQDERWKLWLDSNQKHFTQEDFANFIEDNRRDVIDPAAATMLEVARNLQATTEVNFASSTNLQNGQARIRYEETVKAGVPTAGDMEVPQEFTIKVPVFYGENPVSITARLRFRISQGKLTFHYKLYRPVETMNDAFLVAVRDIAAKVERFVLLGSVA